MKITTTADKPVSTIPILDIEGLHIKSDEDILVNGISFKMYQGEILGVVGESGSGKTLTALAITNLLPKGVTMSADKAFSCGVNLQPASNAYKKEIKDKQNILTQNDKLASNSKQKLNGVYLSNIFQDPLASLNPTIKVGYQVEEVLYLHTTLSKVDIYKKSVNSLTTVGLKADEIYEKYPHELSGGMRQRVMIAMAIVNSPKLLVADEPTTALDTVSQLQILNLLKQINMELGVSILLISHDLSVIKSICSRCIVMKAGKIVESGEIDTIFTSPQDSYTKKLINSIPTINIKIGSENTKQLQLNENTQLDKSLSLNCNIVEIKNLNVYYNKTGYNPLIKTGKKQALHDVSLNLKSGEVLGIVGESGSGKSTLALAVAGLINVDKGVVYTAENRPQIVFQDPSSSLNPTKKIWWILQEPMRIDHSLSKEERKDKVYQIAKDVGLDSKYLDRYPYELSGGQKQRVCIAYALLSGSKLIILDEPLSALDATIQHQMLELLKKVKDEYSLSYIFISHDLAVISQICNKVAVIHNGEVVELGTVEEIFTNSKNEHTKLLLASILTINKLTNMDNMLS